jgi:hypothetical protein
VNRPGYRFWLVETWISSRIDSRPPPRILVMAQPYVVTARQGSLVMLVWSGVLYVGFIAYALAHRLVLLAVVFAVVFGLVWLVFPPIRWRKGSVLATFDDHEARFRLGGPLAWNEVTALRTGTVLARSSGFGPATQSRVLVFVAATDSGSGPGAFPLWERANAWHMNRRFGSRFTLTEFHLTEPFDDVVARIAAISGLTTEFSSS